MQIGIFQTIRSISNSKKIFTVLALGILLVSVSLSIPVRATAGTDIGAGVMELDGNIQDNTGTNCFPTPPAGGCSLDLPTDWGDLFTTSGGTFPLPTGALVANFTSDQASPDPSWFTSGNHETQDISSWQCGSQTPSPAKTNILNAYSVKFTITGGSRNGHTILYMAFERESNNGDSNNGFWILQASPVGCNPATGSFTGSHLNGDLLVASLFTSGGSITSINVYSWVKTVSQNFLNTTAVESGVDCSVSTGFKDICGSVNTANLVTPWPSSALHQTGNNLEVSEFYEVGLDLTALGFTNCATTIMSDTRASPTGTTGPLQADLKDFVFENLNSCNTTTSTLSSQTGTVAPGSSVTDTATVTSASGGGTPTGSVQFYLCFSAGSPTSCDVTVAGNKFGSPQPLSGGGVATSPAVTGSSTPINDNAAGYYCWSAVYIPTDGFRDSRSTTTTNECFHVVAPTTTTTTSSTTASNVVPGTGVTDGVVVVAVPSSAGTPTGSVQFYVCGPTSTATSCATVPANALGSPVTLVNGAATSDAVNGTSTPVNDTRPGFYCFSAVYTPDTSNFQTSSSTTTTNECFKVVTSIPKVTAFGYNNTPDNNDPTTGSGTVVYAVTITNYATTPVTLSGNLAVTGTGATVSCMGGNTLTLSGSVAANGGIATFSLTCHYSGNSGDTVTAVLKASFTDISGSGPVSGSPATSIFTIQKT